jgi:hypothetical protein
LAGLKKAGTRLMCKVGPKPVVRTGTVAVLAIRQRLHGLLAGPIVETALENRLDPHCIRLNVGDGPEAGSEVHQMT